MKITTTGTIFVFLAVMASMIATPAFADHAKATVSIPAGTSVPGCETTNSCFVPAEVTVDVGGEVTWSNDDTAAHTVTSGDLKVDPDNVGTEFDSSLFMAGKTFSHKFTAAGEYPYFCMVHPWMSGKVIVQEAMAEPKGELMVTINTGTANAGEQMTIDVEFTSMDGKPVEHVNYDIMATQMGKVVLNEKGAHKHDGKGAHTTMALEMAASDENPVDVKVTFNGFGINPPFTGPIGQVAQKQVVPEFGTIAVMILGIAIVSIIAVTAKSKVIPRI
jgi:predicted secreted protein with PEFG-CTERM motif